MRTGKLNVQIGVLKYDKQVEDAGFGEVGAWKPKAMPVWAEMLKQRITPQVMQGDGEAVLVTQGFNIRPMNIAKGDRVVAKGRTYDVLDVDTSDSTKYVLTCKEMRP
jgi:hypothetical protein